MYKRGDLVLMMVVARGFIPPQGIFVLILLAQSVVVCAIYFANIDVDRHPDVDLTTPDFLNKYGYPSEIHHTVTEDGYILEIHRIIGVSVNGIYRSSWKGPVLLQHGLGGSSADWVVTGPRKSLAYLLADQGYDVWLGNSRGNIYSRNHTLISPTNRAFWDFSWHEMGVFDLPAVIDHILNQTKYEKIFYVGHSQGTTQFWVMASERPNYNAKIVLMAAFAPSAYTANLRGPVTKLATLTQLGLWIGEHFGYPEFTARSEWGKFVSSIICRDAAVVQFLCNTIIFSIADFHSEELSWRNLSVIIGHVPAGGSWKQFIHYGQGATEQGRFRQFDYNNDEKNLRLYNSSIPPEYMLENIRAPVAIFSSENDWLATSEDIDILESRLHNLIFTYKVPIDTFSHYDFLWGKHTPALVYGPLFKLLEKYST